MALLHVVAFSWKAPMPSEQLADLEAALRALAATTSGVETYDVGRDLGLRETNADFGVVARFTGVAAFESYMNDPTHRAIIDRFVAPNVAVRSALQWQVQ